MKKTRNISLEEMQEIGKRIKVARISLGLTQEVFGKTFKMRQTSVAQVENGYNGPNLEILKWLCGKGIDLNWLITGETTAENEAFELTEWNMKNKILVKLLGYLNEEELNAIEQMVRVLISHKKNVQKK